MYSMRTMKLIFALGLVGLAPHAFAASFDCTKATSPTEKLICSDAQTSALDSKLQQTYKSALTAASEAIDKKDLAEEQRNWIKYTRAGCQDTVCLRQVYTARIAVLGLNEKHIQNDESFCANASGDHVDANDCGISAQVYRDPNDHIDSFNHFFARRKESGRIVECQRLIRLSNGNHIGPGTGEQTFGGYCILQNGAQRQNVKICNDEMVGDFQSQPVKPQDMSDKKLIEFTYNCSGT
jgi:uncharacterized protein